MSGADVSSSPVKVGLIAGDGDLPRRFAEGVAQRGHHLVAICAAGNSLSADDAPLVHSIFIGQWGRIVDTLVEEGVERAYFAGRFDRNEILASGAFDARFQAVMATLSTHNDNSIMRAYVEDLEREGVIVGSQTDYLSAFQCAPGVLTARVPTRREGYDLVRAFHVAKSVARVDAGQTAVVKDGAVLAIEAIEGTDEALRRAGRFGGSGAVAIKVARPEQDFRFDLPVLGKGTLQAAAEAGLAVLAFEAAVTLLLDEKELVALADQHRLALVAYEPGMEKAWVS